MSKLLFIRRASSRSRCSTGTWGKAITAEPSRRTRPRARKYTLRVLPLPHSLSRSRGKCGRPRLPCESAPGLGPTAEATVLAPESPGGQALHVHSLSLALSSGSYRRSQRFRCDRRLAHGNPNCRNSNVSAVDRARGARFPPRRTEEFAATDV